MDDTRSFEFDGGMEQDFPVADEPRMESPPQVDIDERRMHMRAYNYWASLLDGHAYPPIEALNPAEIAEFTRNSVLLDLSSGLENVSFAYLGAALRAEGGIGSGIRSATQTPSRSILSRLTGHCLEVVANQAPIGFEAEYENQRGHLTLYRGILMPFSSDGDTIDFIYGVINWKELAAAEVSTDIREAVASALSAPSPSDPPALPWGTTALLQERLLTARGAVADMAAADQRSHAALYAALDHAHAFALAAASDPAGYRAILAEAGITSQSRAPMTPIAKLVFGAHHDKTRLAEYAAVLAHAHRHKLPHGGLRTLLEGHPGGLKAIVKAERALRQPDSAPAREARARAILTAAPALASVALGDVESAFVHLVGRREADGSIAILGLDAAEASQLMRMAKKLNR